MIAQIYESQRFHSRLGIACVVIASVTTMACGAVYSRTPERVRGPEVKHGRHFWRTLHEVVWVHNLSTEIEEVVGIDTRTGKKQSLVRYRREPRPDAGSLSPAGNWFLYVRGKPKENQWSAVQLSDHRTVTWPIVSGANDIGTPVWMLDDKRWAEIVQRDRTVVCRMRSVAKPGVDTFSFDTSGEKLTPLGARPDGGILLTDPLGHLSELRLDPKEYRHLGSVRLPDGASLVNAHYSPEAGLTAWPLIYPTQPAGDMLFSFNTKQSRNSGKWMTISVSNPDGSNMHALGTYWVAPNTPPFSLYLIDWTPDGKYVSFFYQSSMWRLPVIQVIRGVRPRH